MAGSWMADRVLHDGPPGIDRSDMEVGGVVRAIGNDVADLEPLVLEEDAVGIARADPPDELVDPLPHVAIRSAAT